MRLTDSQRECVQDTFGIPAVVAAGAGSGKTATLTARIVYALEHPELSHVHDIEQALIITYTNKAASELKARIKGALEEAGLGVQALKVDGAWISTIHGMCSRILKENAFTFGVDPAYAILSDDVRGKILDETIELELNLRVDDSLAERQASLLAEYGRVAVKEMLETIIDKALESGAPMDECFVLPHEEDLASCLFDLANYTLEFRDRCAGGGKTATAYHAAADASLRKLLNVEGRPANRDDIGEWYAGLGEVSIDRALDLASVLVKPGGNFGKLAKEPLASAGDVPVNAILRRAYDLRLAIGRPHIETLLDIARRVADRFAEQKRLLGVMDNNDLIAKAARALADPVNLDVRRRYNEQFQLVMVDEFQDTNQVQVDMINLIAGGRSGRISDKLCVVGDAQQSIYRFRNADLEVFREHVSRVGGEREGGPCGKVIAFQENFRSHAQILAFSKEVFERTFDTGMYLELLHGRDEGRASAKTPFNGADGLCRAEESNLPRRVNVRVYTDAGNKSISEAAAAAIARDFAALADAGHEPAQMAVLLGSMTHADEYAKALQGAGLRCAITGGSVFKTSVEAGLIVDLCHALSNMRHTSALASVLTSDLFCLSAGDLLTLVRGFGAQGARKAQGAKTTKATLADVFERAVKDVPAAIDALPDDVSRRLACALSVLGAAARQVGSKRMSSLVEDVLVNSGWLLRLGADGPVRAGNAFKAIRMLADIENADHVDALDLAQRLRVRIDELKEAPGVLSAKGDDFVRIMTIHASKGLQFPIVAVSDAELRARDTAKLKTLSAGNKVYLSLDAGTTMESYPGGSIFDIPGSRISQFCDARDAETLWRMVEQPNRASDSSEGIKALNRMAERAEHQRKLYVAYTRAEDALIVNLKGPSSTGGGRPAKTNDEEPSVARAIQDLLCGEGESYACEKGGAAQGFIPIHTKYAGHPEQDLDWIVRLNVESLAETQEGADAEVASDANGSLGASGIVGGGPETAGDLGSVDGETAAACREPLLQTAGEESEARNAHAVPTSRLDASLSEVAYRAQWAEGVLSASAIKGGSDNRANDGDSFPAPAPESKAAESLHSAAELPHPTVVSPDAVDAEPPLAECSDSAEGSSVAFDDEPESGALATERGTAFHALCEWAARNRGEGGAFVMPPSERIAAIAKSYGLSETQTAELPAMLERWLNSEVAGQMQARDTVVPECPFAVKLAEGGPGFRPIVLQGFIDLLAYDAFGSGIAHVVDYKTGKHLQTDAERRRDYEAQAQTYAYALLLQGFDDVQLDFVFVDQPDRLVTHFPAEGESPYTVQILRSRLGALVGSAD